MASRQNAQVQSNFPPGLSQPALRALTGAGITRLEHLTRFTESEIGKLHGMGPNGLRGALAAAGLSYATAPMAAKAAAKPAKPTGSKRR